MKNKKQKKKIKSLTLRSRRSWNQISKTKSILSNQWTSNMKTGDVSKNAQRTPPTMGGLLQPQRMRIIHFNKQICFEPLLKTISQRKWLGYRSHNQHTHENTLRIHEQKSEQIHSWWGPSCYKTEEKVLVSWSSKFTVENIGCVGRLAWRVNCLKNFMNKASWQTLSC